MLYFASMIRRYFFRLILGCVAISSCHSSSRPKSSETSILHFAGRFPCGDCPGILASLVVDTLHHDYTEKYIYLQRHDSLITRGKATLKGRLLTLDGEDEQKSRCYLFTNDSTLQMADDSGRVFKEVNLGIYYKEGKW